MTFKYKMYDLFGYLIVLICNKTTYTIVLYKCMGSNKSEAR